MGAREASLPGQAVKRFLLGEDVLFVLASRVCPASFFLLIAIAKIEDLGRFLAAAERGATALAKLAFAAQLGYRVAVIAFLALAVVLFVIRTPPKAKAKGMIPMAMAIAGSFMMSLVAVLPAVETPLALTVAAALLLLLGTGFSLAALLALGRSFSITPEARQLVMSGPYAIVRHPMYLGEVLGSAGMALQGLSVFSLLLYLVFVWVQLQRMTYEEGVLQRAFAEYDTYRGRTARLIPWLY